MEEIYENLLTYFDDRSLRTSHILALTLRDIFLNDLVYITSAKEWKVYKSKKWQKLDKEGMKRKILKLSNILSNLVERVIDVEINNEKKKKFINRIMKINKGLCTDSYDYDEIEKECIPYFSV